MARTVTTPNSMIDDEQGFANALGKAFADALNADRHGSPPDQLAFDAATQYGDIRRSLRTVFERVPVPAAPPK